MNRKITEGIVLDALKVGRKRVRVMKRYKENEQGPVDIFIDYDGEDFDKLTEKEKQRFEQKILLEWGIEEWEE